MSSKQAVQPITETKTPVFVELENLLSEMKDITTAIARRAYEFFEARGRELGHDIEDWFRAETELVRHVPVEIRDAGQQIVVHAEVPGFTANDLKISVTERQLLLSGKVEASTRTEQNVYNERRTQQFYRIVTLPTNVDATNATAMLRNGVLELTLPKTASPATVDVAVTAS
ncbi:MAG TPA: Hsp20 family protein [Blastocatellia bacterium]|nr:Hsp20 family protein [Blastocatellia bacterium]